MRRSLQRSNLQPNSERQTMMEDRRSGDIPEHPCDGPFPTDMTR